ncbi:hypothetical protein JKF63_03760 [Porcisia hertigi]|uniref:Uncharacterized protein n=1 Tax=Porcisia hertigi TaxID=2761500 RepID=A0A836L3M8_9TRYP|nr:hypothetical protein JKF63_03760 [Porcisia hertigi]
MECLTFAARYQPEARTLEFNLTDAPLVDVVTDVTVCPCGATPPLWRTSATQTGLFYGHNTFVFDPPLVFNYDMIALVCCVRVRQQRLSTLLALASDVLFGNAEELSRHFAATREAREYMVLLTEVSRSDSGGVQDNAFVYFTSQAVPPPLMEGSSTAMVSSLPAEPLITHPACVHGRYMPSLLTLSAHSLCYL